MVSVLSALVTAGCVTGTEVVEIRPQCSVPPQPALPQIEGSALEDLDEDTYEALEDREKRLVDWALEMRATLAEVCEDGT